MYYGELENRELCGSLVTEFNRFNLSMRYFHAPVITYCNKGRCKKILFDGKIALWCKRMGLLN